MIRKELWFGFGLMAIILTAVAGMLPGCNKTKRQKRQ